MTIKTSSTTNATCTVHAHQKIGHRLHVRIGAPYARTHTHRIKFLSNLVWSERAPCRAAFAPHTFPCSGVYASRTIFVEFPMVYFGRIRTTRTEIPNYLCRTNWNQLVASECVSCAHSRFNDIIAKQFTLISKLLVSWKIITAYYSFDSAAVADHKFILTLAMCK